MRPRGLPHALPLVWGLAGVLGGGAARADAGAPAASSSSKASLAPLPHFHIPAEPSASSSAGKPAASAAPATATKPASSTAAPGASASAQGPTTAAPPTTVAPLATTPKKPPPPPPLKAAKPATKPLARPGVRPIDAVVRRGVAGGPTADDVSFGVESPELHALHQAELEIFPSALPPMGSPWPNELPSPLTTPEGLPRAHATGLPPAPVPSAPRLTEGGHDVSWLAHLQLPDLPVRWDARLVRYLEFYKDDPRGRQLMAFWIKRSGRYRDAVRRALRKKALPEDLAWLPMVESGYDALARSPAGAGGLWQLTSDTAHLYGLSTDRWADQRFNPAVETDAAIEMLSDLYRRFGSWELAMAAYNMGYGGVMSVVRRYNTNDFWTLSRMEAALPWETTLYVPKIIAAAIVGRNLATFGYTEAGLDAPLDGEEIRVAPSTSLQAVASAAGCSAKELEALNPELRAGRTPPPPPGVASTSPDAAYPVRVPFGKGTMAQANLARSKETPAAVERYTVRFGESLEQIAAARRVPVARIHELNAIAPGEVIRGGTVLLVPHGTPVATKPADASATASNGSTPDASKPVVVVPPDAFVYAGRKRVFYRVVTGDTLPVIATQLQVEVDDLRRWNDLDPAARLQDGMTLQAFVAETADLSHVVLLSENDVRPLVVGTDEFFAYVEGTKGKKRFILAANAGDTLETIGRRYGVNAASMERINGRGRHESLKQGENIVVYVASPGSTGSTGSTGAHPMNDGAALPFFGLTPLSNGPLPAAPEASLLPPIPAP